jgi:hypothetical protein
VVSVVSLVVLSRIVTGPSTPTSDDCAFLHGECTCQPPARIRPLSHEQDARVTARSPDVRRPTSCSSSLGPTEGFGAWFALAAVEDVAYSPELTVALRASVRYI